MKETRQFLQATIPHCLIGLRILNDLVTEMNYKSKNRTATQQRKVSVSFRDIALLDVFEVALSMINQLATRAISFDSLPPDQHRRVHETLMENTCVCKGGRSEEEPLTALTLLTPSPPPPPLSPPPPQPSDFHF